MLKLFALMFNMFNFSFEKKERNKLLVYLSFDPNSVFSRRADTRFLSYF